MKNTYITIFVLLVLITGAVFFIGSGKKAEAPVSETTQSETSATEDTTAIMDSLAVKEFVVSGKNFSFTPSLITVKKGDRVKITFQNTNGFHNFVIDEFGVATSQKQSPDTEVLEFTANKVGSFEYYCSVGSHRMMGMKGMLVIN